jgi:hypothetical protein
MKYVAETGLFLTLVVIPFPFPKSGIRRRLLVPLMCLKLTVKGEQPEFGCKIQHQLGHYSRTCQQ